MFADGVLLLSAPDEPGFVARLRIFNPDGSEAELSGNGAREAVLYLRRRGWTDQRPVLDPDRGRRDPPDDHLADHLPPRPRPRAAAQRRLSRRAPPDGAGELTADGRTWRFQHVQVGNPQCAIRVADEAALDALDLAAIGPAIERHELFPNRTNVSWYAPLAPGRIRARIFERGVGETSASGTGATGAAVAHVLAGGDSPVTVVLDGGELEVEVGEDLHVTLTGWAVPGVPRHARR